MPQNTLIKSQHTLSYFTRQLISFYRHKSFLLFSLLFVVSSGTLFSQGSVVTWGLGSAGGDSSSVASSLSSGVTEIFSTELAYAALKSDGSVVTWGRSDYGGDSSSASGLNSGVTEISSTNRAFAALRVMVVWSLGGLAHMEVLLLHCQK